MDPGSKATDKLIAEAEQRIGIEYAQAEREIKEKLDDYYRRFELKDKKWQEWVKEGKKEEAEYRQWRIGQLAIGKRWEEMRETISEDLLNAHKIAISIAQGYCPEVYALNHDYGTFQVERASLVDTSYTLYSREAAERIFRADPQMLPGPGVKTAQDIADGKILAWNNKHLQSVATQAILQGNSIPDIATRIANAAQTDRKSATRNARTMMTNAQNMGRIDSYERAKGMGIPVRKQWLATLDSRTRHEHRELDGETEETDKPFIVGRDEIMYPGDPKAPGYLTYNCRCTLIASIAGYESDLSDISLRHNKNLGDMTYDEWKASKEETSRPILYQETQQDEERARYVREYRERGGEVKSARNYSLDVDSRFVQSAPPAGEQGGGPTSRPMVDGQDLMGKWEWDKDKYRYIIEDIVHTQGFDGLPQVVSQERLDEIVKQSGMIAQRVYVAPDAETLAMYRDQLLNGEWYVDCSVGGATKGQGMYTCADYTGTISDGIKTDMETFKNRGIKMQMERMQDRYLDGLTPESVKELTGRDVSGDDLRIIQDKIRDLYDARRRGIMYSDRLSREDLKRLDQIDDVRVAVEKSVEGLAKKQMEEHPAQYKIETLTLDPSARIIDLETLYDDMKANGYIGNWVPTGNTKGYHYMDPGAYAAMRGYDAINAKGFGKSKSYTIIVNRTKTYILE